MVRDQEAHSRRATEHDRDARADHDVPPRAQRIDRDLDEQRGAWAELVTAAGGAAPGSGWSPRVDRQEVGARAPDAGES